MEEQYGTAIVKMGADEVRYVVRADPVILVDDELLRPGALMPGIWEPGDGGGTLTLDSAGTYRYRYVRRYDGRLHVFERIAA